MKEWYGLTDKEYEKLSRHVTTLDLIRSLSLFHSVNHPVGKIGVLMYLDDNGADSGKLDHFIFKAIMRSMPAEDQAEIIRYIDWLESNPED